MWQYSCPCQTQGWFWFQSVGRIYHQITGLIHHLPKLCFFRSIQWINCWSYCSASKQMRLIVEKDWLSVSNQLLGELLYFDLRPGPKKLFKGDTPEGSDTFQWPVIERDHVGRLRLMIWDKVKVPLCHYSDALEESNLWTAWHFFPLDDD